ncbi:TIGR00282 family metallophosphoesterase [uncultured Mailhella sp.]|uniref:TIGR00282 family metallophosphoesterase n=1 Tax=uncultured Mailhella sp. TaxID=1981031 RepID=UPI0025FEE390|nr:TIGR00282 family metallophosphoesterase [uncultured Mailhella sp.]
MRILFLGDVVGKAGRLAVKQYLPELFEELSFDVVIANGENIAGGMGMTSDTLDELFASGVDLVTAGNHVWRHREIFSRLDRDRRIVRPFNYPEGAPGRGYVVHTLRDGRRLAVINLLGTVFMDPLPCPFRTVLNLLDGSSCPGAAEHSALLALHNGGKDATNAEETHTLLHELDGVAVRIVDFHAETTGEKKTMGWALDGRVSAVIGTHTHVQTADAQILPHGTAYISDAGMCGVEQSSLGMDFEPVLARFLTRMPHPFKPAKGPVSLNGVYVDVDDDTGLAREIRAVRAHCPRASRGGEEQN